MIGNTEWRKFLKMVFLLAKFAEPLSKLHLI